MEKTEKWVVTFNRQIETEHPGILPEIVRGKVACNYISIDKDKLDEATDEDKQMILKMLFDKFYKEIITSDQLTEKISRTVS